MTCNSLAIAVSGKDYRAVEQQSVTKLSHSTSRQPKTKLPALSVPVPETHRAVSHKEDRGGVVAQEGSERGVARAPAVTYA